VVPDRIHMRTPLFIGSTEDVALVESFIQERAREQQEREMLTSQS